MAIQSIGKEQTIESKTCFVIMPFSGTTKLRTQAYWTNHYENLLKPLIEHHSLIVYRSQPLRQNILRDIIHNLVYSKIVVADLTDENPNVYWELGVRQSFRHGTITIIDENSKGYKRSKKIPFDLAGKSILTYSSTDLSKHSFKELFDRAIIDCLEKQNRPDSDVLETVTGRTSIYQVIHQEEIKQKLKGMILENQSNYSKYKTILEQVDDNLNRRGIIKKPKKFMMVLRLNSPSISVLLTERYIDDEKLYIMADRMLSLINRINYEIDIWYEEIANNNVENWFNERRIEYMSWFENFQKKLLELEQTVSKYC